MSEKKDLIEMLKIMNKKFDSLPFFTKDRPILEGLVLLALSFKLEKEEFLAMCETMWEACPLNKIKEIDE